MFSTIFHYTQSQPRQRQRTIGVDSGGDFDETPNPSVPSSPALVAKNGKEVAISTALPDIHNLFYRHSQGKISAKQPVMTDGNQVSKATVDSSQAHSKSFFDTYTTDSAPEDGSCLDPEIPSPSSFIQTSASPDAQHKNQSNKDGVDIFQADGNQSSASDSLKSSTPDRDLELVSEKTDSTDPKASLLGTGDMTTRTNTIESDNPNGRDTKGRSKSLGSILDYRKTAR